MTSFTPSASTARLQAEHEFAINGASQGPGTTTTTLPITDHTLETRTHVVVHKGQSVTIDRYTHEYSTPISEGTDRLVFTIEGLHRTILVTRTGNRLLIDINHLRFRVTPASARQIIEIHTQDGNDSVYIAATVMQPLHINTGSGDDTVVTSSGFAQVYTGPGNDRVMTSDGRTYIETGEGNDVVNAIGSGVMTVYTGKGDDFVRGGAGRCYIETGEGNDIAIGGEQHSIISGGDGDDLLYAGQGSNALYSGLGDNAFAGLKPNDKAHSIEPVTTVSEGVLVPANTQNDATSFIDNQVSKIDAQSLASSGLVIQGAPAFVERVTDDLKMLLGSTYGQQLLAALSKSIHASQKPITIVELKRIDNGMYQPALLMASPYIAGGSAGWGAFGGTVYYNPAHQKDESVPLASLYHELCHAYNYVTGTIFSGTGPDPQQPHMPPAQADNAELQVVGLPASVEPFDFDNDPLTPPTRTNPVAFTENGIREELGLPSRKSYIRFIPG